MIFISTFSLQFALETENFNAMILLLDNGHGQNTPGKRSPDGHFREYAYNRFLAHEIRQQLLALGLDVRLLVPELDDIPLSERCRRVNVLCKEFGKDQVILLSLHVNAAGNGSKRGGGAALRRGARPGLTSWPRRCMRRRRSGCRICICAATIRTENLFMDNREDVAFLESEEGSRAIVGLHVDGILQYLTKSKNL